MIENDKALRLVLSPEQSAEIRDHGINFAVVGPGSYPDSGGLFVAFLFKLDRKTADAAARVAMGKARAVRISPTQTESIQHPTA